MNTLFIALFLARLIFCTAFPSSNSLAGGGGSSNRHEIFRQEIATAIADKPSNVHTVRVSPLPPTKADCPNCALQTAPVETVDAEDVAISSKKIFADRFIHPSKLKHGADRHGVMHSVVHVTVPDSWGTMDEPLSTKKHHHLYQPMPSKSKFHWSKVTTQFPHGDFGDVKWVTPTHHTTLAPTTTQPTTTTAKSMMSNGGTPSWLVDDWDDDDEEEETVKTIGESVVPIQPQIIPAAPVIEALPPTQPPTPAPTPAAPAPPPIMPPIIPPVSYDIHDVKASPSSAYHHIPDRGVPSYSIFDIPTGIATEIPVSGAKKHHGHHETLTTQPLAPSTTTTKLPTTHQPPPPRHHVNFPSAIEHQIIRPAVISKSSSFNFPNNNLKLLNLDGEAKQQQKNLLNFPTYPTLESDLITPTGDTGRHMGDHLNIGLGLGGGGGVGSSDVLPTSRHFPSLIDQKHARIDEQPYFHSKTDYLEMPHAFPTPEYEAASTTPEMPIIDDEVMPHVEDDTPALQPTLTAGLGGDTFVLKIPEEGAPAIISANLVPVASPPIDPTVSHRKTLEPPVKPEPAKPAHFQTTAAPYLRTDSPYRRPITDFDGGIMSHASTTPTPPIVDDGDTAVGWSAWSLKVGCSRTCGMGIEIYERFCQIPGGCANRSTIRYKACAQYVCPTGDSSKAEDPTPHGAATYSALAYSSRHRQCAKFNSQPFDGLFYEWTPYYTTTGQCELFCLAKSANFYHKFGDQVEDGTACDPYSESSICIKGKCHPVGCDGVVGSRLKRDRCGVCGGFNDSCNTFDGIVRKFQCPCHKFANSQLSKTTRTSQPQYPHHRQWAGSGS